MRIILLGLLTCLALSIHFSVMVPPHQVRCFYEHLDYQSKYNVEVRPMDNSQYEFFIQMVQSDDVIYSRVSTSPLEPTIVSKFAPQANYYGFCVKNLLPTSMNTIFKLESGIELMELSLLPTHSDNEHLNNEIEFLERQKMDLFHILESVQGTKQDAEALTNSSGTKALWFALVGLGVIALANLGFYKQVKSTLKQRKLI